MTDEYYISFTDEIPYANNGINIKSVNTCINLTSRGKEHLSGLHIYHLSVTTE